MFVLPVSQILPTVAGITTYAILTSTNNLTTCNAKIRHFFILFKAFDIREENSKKNDA